MRKDLILVYTHNHPELIDQIIKFIESKGFKIDLETDYGDGSTGVAFIADC